MGSTISTRGTKAGYLKTENFKLTLNGQSRHLDGAGIDRDYLMDRLMPMVHTNCQDTWDEVRASSLGQLQAGRAAVGDIQALSELKGRKEIYSFPFSLAPESASPAGAVNFSKVSHANLKINVKGIMDDATTTTPSDDYQVDVYGIYYNWLAIRDGRAMTSFA